MLSKPGRYSKYIRPISYAIDLLIINSIGLLLFMDPLEFYAFLIYISACWIIMSYQTNFYAIYRYTRVVKIMSLTFLQATLFTLVVFAFFGFFNKLQRTPDWLFKYIAIVFTLIVITKLTVYYVLKRYRRVLGGNTRKTVIIGSTPKSRQLREFFINQPEYGYQFQKLFEIDKKTEDLNTCFQYIIDKEVDEIYCSIGELNNRQIEEFINFADNNLRSLKFLPDNKEIFTKKLNYDSYGVLPILSLRTIPLDSTFNKVLKRTFDIILSSIVILFILSWLTPIIAFLIRLESKGPIFFKQKRNGLDNTEFYCYKFRSMRTNPTAHLHQATRDDMRVTQIGKFIRKTSIDELPQFVNVLLGDMSTVGPRPHMVSHTNMYAERIDKFMVRHLVKPGITGLAQISGFRGEVETDIDIINRVKYDIFYVENWSLLLDIKIIFQTVLNAVQGEEKAY